jgi:hypothetical protein
MVGGEITDHLARLVFDRSQTHSLALQMMA